MDTQSPAVVLLQLPEWKWMGVQKYLDTVADAFVELVRETGVDKVDYIVTISADWTDLVFSNQNFFDAHINGALEKAGLKINVEGQRGGGGRGLCERIRTEFPSFQDQEIYVSWYVLASGCLYRLRRA